MLGFKFYHATMRKYVALFGTLLNDVYIDRLDTDGETIKTVKTPITYGAKETYLTRLQQNPDLFREIDKVLPRMAFEIRTITYDNDRKLNTLGRIRHQANTSINSYDTQYNPVPYNFGITLSILARNYDDATRIIEQIVPFFRPAWTCRVTLIPELNHIFDIPITLDSVAISPPPDGPPQTTTQLVTWVLEFTLRGWLFSPTTQTSAITEVIVNMRDEGDANTAMVYTVSPGLTANGESTTTANTAIPRDTVPPDSPYGFIEDYFASS